MGWLTKFFNLIGSNPSDNAPVSAVNTASLSAMDNTPRDDTPRSDAYNRLKLVLMHDRTQLSPTILEAMRDELVEVISKYVVIDKSALDLSLENESSTIALVANIPVIRSRT
jgi:cell division topological specificity factor